MTVGVLGQLRVPITADSSQYNWGLRTMVQRTRAAARDGQAALAPMTRGFGALTAAMGAAGALAGIASFAGAIRIATEALSEFDRIGKDARATGVSTDFFQTLSLAANEASISQDRMTTSLQFFVRQIGEAQSGTGEFASRLREANPELLQAVLAAGDQEQALRLVADAVRDAGSATEAATLAVAAFGRSGVEMVEVLRQGSDGFDQAAERARRLGIIIDEDLIARAEDLQTEFGVAQQVIDVQFKEVLVQLAPVIVDVAQAIAEIARVVNTVSDAIGNLPRPPEWFRGLVDRASLASPLGRLPDILGDGGELLERFNDRVAEQEAASRAVGPAISDRWPGLGQASVPGSGAGASTSLFNGLGLPYEPGSFSGSGVSGELQDLSDDLEEVDRRQREASQSALDLTASLYSLPTQAEVASNALNAMGGEIGGSLSPLLYDLTENLNDTERALLRFAATAAQTILGSPQFSNNPLAGFASSLLGGFAGGFATGGTLRPGQWGIAGENGPEPIFAGNAPLTVYPNTTGSMNGQAGGQSAIRVDLGPGLVGQLLQRAGDQAVQIVHTEGPAMAVEAVQDHRKYGNRI